MALIDLFAISKNYDEKQLLNQVDFHLHNKQRAAIIGQNGCGKSTLMKIAAGYLLPDEGRRVASKETQIEMLSQTPKFPESLTVREAIEDALKEIKAKKKEYEDISSKLSEDFNNESLKQSLDRCSNFLDHHNAWTIENKVEEILLTFKLGGLKNQLISRLSGGEQRRVALAGLILKKPDVLILDEPTNHLDVHMVRFLEDFILKENFTLLFVSHDRYFIDRIATQIIEVSENKLKKYIGGYGDFLRQKEKDLIVAEKKQHNMEKHLKSELSWLNRGVKARTKRNMGRVKRVQELKGEVSKEKSTLIRRMRTELMREKVNINTSDSGKGKKIFFDIYQLVYKIEDRVLINKFKAKILQKERIAIIGNNGSGKSTLLKLLIGELKPTSGTIKSADIKVGYFDQGREDLDDDKDLITTFCPNGGEHVEIQGKRRHVYGYLKSFNFPAEDLTKKIGMLSGGERNRVALARLFTKSIDCLILDEPTNDLDIQTINILEEKLQEFPGVIIIVSHDRYFVDKIAEKLFAFKGDGSIEVSHKNYSEYLEIEEELRVLEYIDNQAKKTDITEDKPKNVRGRVNKLSYKDKLKLENLPDEITSLENKIKECSDLLITHGANAKKVMEISEKLNLFQKELEEKEIDYFSLLSIVEA